MSKQCGSMDGLLDGEGGAGGLQKWSRGGRGCDWDRGRGGNSMAGSMDGLLDGEGGVNEDSSVAPTGWQEQDGEEFAGGRWVWEGVGAY